MNNQNNFNGNMDKMIVNASKMLGTSPEKLKGALEKGAIDDILANIKPGDAKKLKGIMQNKEMVEKLMKSPQAMEFMKQVGYKK